MATNVGYDKSTRYKDALVCKLLIPRSSFELSHRLPGRGKSGYARRRVKTVFSLSEGRRWTATGALTSGVATITAFVTAGFPFDDEPAVNSDDELASVEFQRSCLGQGNGSGVASAPG